ncbi:MAG: hypothetical protein ACRD1T_22700, partial [Acidimicrobiia bacterium]
LGFGHYQDFADYLSHYASEYALANGINIYAVSMANEPDALVSWDSCGWYSDWISTFLSIYLAPTFATNRVGAKVIGPKRRVGTL